MTQKAVKISCLPKSLEFMEISELHNNLRIIEGSDLVFDDYIIGRSKLEKKDVTDSNVKSIRPDELKHSNVFLTYNNDLIGITCASNKILIANGSPSNCTDKVFWTNSKVITTKMGIFPVNQLKQHLYRT